MSQRGRRHNQVRRGLMAMVLLVSSAGVTLLAARIVGYSLPAGRVFVSLAVLAMLAVASLPALDTVSAWREQRTGLYWLAQLVTLVVSGILLFAAGEWVLR